MESLTSPCKHGVRPSDILSACFIIAAFQCRSVLERGKSVVQHFMGLAACSLVCRHAEFSPKFTIASYSWGTRHDVGHHSLHTNLAKLAMCVGCVLIDSYALLLVLRSVPRELRDVALQLCTATAARHCSWCQAWESSIVWCIVLCQYTGHKLAIVRLHGRNTERVSGVAAAAESFLPAFPVRASIAITVIIFMYEGMKPHVLA